MATPSLTKKSARDRKNPRSAEVYAKLKREQNAARGKQMWVGGASVAEGGHWERS
jgi:hypothetical protein